MQTEQLLYWSSMTDKEHDATSGSNKEVFPLPVGIMIYEELKKEILIFIEN